MSDLFAIPDDEPTPIDMSNPFKGIAIGLALSLPIDSLIIGLIVMWIKSR